MITPLTIGPYTFDNALVVAPMAGVTDRPFRQLCRSLGAGLAPSEMLTSDMSLWHTKKSQLRMNHEGEPGPISVQIAGAIPEQLASAARVNVEKGAQLIDINMGCPAKKVCNVLAGSALLSDIPLVRTLLAAVVAAVDVPVTLKFRTGPSPDQINAPLVAKIAEDAGIAALAIHGRTRTQKYKGHAEYDTIAQICQSSAIPVIANGDIDTPEKARQVLDYTQADGLMIGRAAQGNPWIFREIEHFINTGSRLSSPTQAERQSTMTSHLRALHQFYGEHQGVRIARKHIGWYLSEQPQGEQWRKLLVRAQSANHQHELLEQYFAGEPLPVSVDPTPNRQAA